MLQPGDAVFEKFRVIERVAFGAFSAVYKVEDKTSGQIVCLKAEILQEEHASMLDHEYRIGKMLDSPFTCRTFEYFESPERKVMTMELLTDNLANIRRKRKNPPSLGFLANITLQCVKGLAYLHGMGIIHSDVKPSNFAFRLRDGGYDVVTFDYGLSEAPGESETVTKFRNELVRNPRYLSLNTQKTGKWLVQDDYVALVYSIADFWKDELPWDGRTTNKLVLEVKDGYDVKSLLPPELQFMVDCVDAPEEMCARLEALLRTLDRNVDEELHYILDGPDPGLKRKFVNYIFEDKGTAVDRNQHSA